MRRGVPSQGLAGAVVELVLDLLKTFSGMDSEVGPLGDVVPQESVGVLVRAETSGPAFRGCLLTAASDDHEGVTVGDDVEARPDRIG